MISNIAQHSRKWAKTFLERTMGVTIYRKRPICIELYRTLCDIRSWSPDDLVFDVGANAVQTVLRLQRHFPSPDIHAFEPVSSSYRKLRRRTQHLSNVQCHQQALGRTSGRADIHLHETTSAMNSFSPPWKPSASECMRIPTVDEIMTKQGLGFVHLLKIDTEGHELEVLEGARDTLNSSRVAIIQVEVGVDRELWPYTHVEDVRRCLSPMDYFLLGFFEQRARLADAPKEWDGEISRGYTPRVLDRCEAVFVGASLDGILSNRHAHMN